MKKRELFVISDEAFGAVDQDTMRKMVEDLKKMDLYHLPFESIDVRVPGDRVSFMDYVENPYTTRLLREGLVIPTSIREERGLVTNYGHGHWMDFLNVSLDHYDYIKVDVLENCRDFKNQRHEIKKFGSGFRPNERERNAVADLLIVLLATRNAAKERVRNKLAALGIGKGKNRNEYVTTISVPKIMEQDPDNLPGPGGERSPHLRLGHIRSQHHGPGNSLVKMIWIDPVFVNADKDWVSTRKAYRLT